MFIYCCRSGGAFCLLLSLQGRVFCFLAGCGFCCRCGAGVLAPVYLGTVRGRSAQCAHPSTGTSCLATMTRKDVSMTEHRHIFPTGSLSVFHVFCHRCYAKRDKTCLSRGVHYGRAGFQSNAGVDRSKNANTQIQPNKKPSAPPAPPPPTTAQKNSHPQRQQKLSPSHGRALFLLPLPGRIFYAVVAGAGCFTVVPRAGIHLLTGFWAHAKTGQKQQS